MADIENQEAPEGAEEAESEAIPEVENEGQEEGSPEGAEGEAVEEIVEENIVKGGVSEVPPFTIDDVFSLFVPSQNTLDKIVAKVEYLKQLKETDVIACQKAVAIQEMKHFVEEMDKIRPMTEEESNLLDQKQQELFDMLIEFEEITKRVHELAALAEIDSKSSFQISPYDAMLGPPLPTSAILNMNQVSTGVQAPVKMEDTVEFVNPREKLPKMVICSTGDWPPKIVVCEGEKKPKRTTGTNTDSQEILKLQNEIHKTKSGSQIPVKKLYSKLKDLDRDIMDVEKENTQLTRKLLQLLQGDSEEPIEGQPSLTESNKEKDATAESDMKVDPSGDNADIPTEESIARKVSELVEKSPSQDQQLQLPPGMLPQMPNCSCGKRSNAFSLESELTKIETEVQRMLAEIDFTENLSEQKEKKSTVVIGSCNIATLFNTS